MIKENATNPRHLGYVGSLRNAGDEAGDEWFTPDEQLAIFRRILGGGISLDPFSSELANQRVQADKIFTKVNSAFANPWVADSVFMNPPYSRGICAKAVHKAIDEFERKRFKKAIILVNNMTDTAWFACLDAIAIRQCAMTGRIAFFAPDNKPISGNTRGQFVFLLASPKDSSVRRFDALMPTCGRVRGPIINGIAQ
jgi:phage N-6-adenine-methyltransferase